MGQLIMPQKGGVTASGSFDVMFHFHGHEAVRKDWIQVMDGAVLVGVTLGTGSGPYEVAFRGTGAFERPAERKIDVENKANEEDGEGLAENR
jgi:hypothetical protein